MSTFKNLKVFQNAYALAMEIYMMSKSFPPEEKYSLTDQIRRSSRSVCSNFAEAYRKRLYPKHFIMKLSDADAECSETIVWIDFARDCKYLPSEASDVLTKRYEEVGKMLGFMIHTPEKFQ